MKIYHYTEGGHLVGEGVADACPLEPGAWLVPAQATTEKPPTVPAGKRARFAAGVWSLEDLPAPVPEPAAPTVAQLRAVEIRARLLAIDAGSVRAMRAKLMGKGKAQDDSKLNALDAEAEALRVELSALVV
jgi:hypothetical protein